MEQEKKTQKKIIRARKINGEAKRNELKDEQKLEKERKLDYKGL